MSSNGPVFQTLTTEQMEILQVQMNIMKWKDLNFKWNHMYFKGPIDDN